ncbi:hypothetical protein PTKIN_Ptkin14bG0162100 [Pterospermum kingtungense]
MTSTSSVIGGAAFSVFLNLLLGKLVSYGLDFVADYRQVHDQLMEWKSKLPCIQAVLNDAEEKQIKDDGVKKWLADVQDLAYDVDDILDEFAYEDLRLKLQKAQAQTSTSKVRKHIPTCCTSYFSPTSVMFRAEMISNIKKITARLNNLTSQKDVLKLREIVFEGPLSKGKKSRPLQPTSLMDETVLYVGRENEKLEILQLLKSSNTDGALVISILGMGGMGKTTLAQLVYNDPSIKDSFDHKAWVCVSDDFDAIHITKTILSSIDPESGTKIIVTTRLQKVSSNVVTAKAFHLDKLSYDDSLSIFIQHALGARNFSAHPELKEVGQNIVRRCNGLPLATKAMGGLLRTIRDPGAWERIYKSEIWDLPEHQCGIIPALRLSYHHLPPHLKRCFAYSSILPKDYEFEEEEIILLWRTEGMLQQKAKSQVEDFGNQCFQDLVSRSFFQKSSKDHSRYVMHDLMNDLAQLVAGEICFKLDGDKQQKVSCRTRHSSYVRGEYDGVKKFEAFDQVNSLRTFLPLKVQSEEWSGCSFLTNTVLNDLLPKLECLRVLSLKGYWVTELPDFFENAKHLSYLDFSETRIKCLPKSLCTLYHLQTLILRKCWDFEKLPSEICNLKELHYLDISDSYSIKGMPLGVGKLTNLQRLSNFVLGEGDGHRIRELRNLSNLRGDFCLSGLENVKGQNARDAKLNEKWGRDRLTLKWCRDFGNERSKEDEEQVLDFLYPQKKLEQLIIENYGGAKFPAWIADWKEWVPCEGDEPVSEFPKLVRLRIKNCPELLGRLPSRIHSLQKLEIEEC